ncbi:hypothetical protein JQ633_31960 [Bradyrhizobium tropiciagri]|uniref:hypothetical protein n=1 Tax=Bradyrhizobium tropiciagri TaxID=312253 RepID=UPI001BA678F6|nr:hypothetical protein [Bradyrhizobium tropiciagri]MBR0875012.1 hypothetical protein [Bradyrhizobium tropiciagri]
MKRHQAAFERHDSELDGTQIDTGLAQPRSLSDLASFLHGYVIKAQGDDDETRGRRGRAANLEGLAKTLPDAANADHAYAIVVLMRQQAAELAERDPTLSWLPEWKPRVAVSAGGRA